MERRRAVKNTKLPSNNDAAMETKRPRSSVPPTLFVGEGAVELFKGSFILNSKKNEGAWNSRRRSDTLVTQANGQPRCGAAATHPTHRIFNPAGSWSGSRKLARSRKEVYGTVPGNHSDAVGCQSPVTLKRERMRGGGKVVRPKLEPLRQKNIVCPKQTSAPTLTARG